MDIERAIEFILEREARTAAYIEEHSSEIREIRGILKETDHKLKIIATMVGAGMKRLNRLTEAERHLTEAQQRLAEAQQGLAEAQQRTERKIDRLVDALLRQRSNGRPR